MAKRRKNRMNQSIYNRNNLFKNLGYFESEFENDEIFLQYANRLTEYAMSMFEWKNLPDTIDERFLEMSLFTEGRAIFFKDDVVGYVALKTTAGGVYDIYGIPVKRRAYSFNGYQKDLTKDDSIIIYNNLIHTNSIMEVRNYARKLYDIDRTIEVNMKAQKTPVLIACDETQRLTMLNLYQKYDGNTPVIFGEKTLNPNSLKVLSTGAPFVAKELMEIKVQIWNEALTYLGISNVNYQKKERMITDEVTRNQGGTIASRYSRLEARRKACKQINEMFGLDIWVDFREDYQDITGNGGDTVEGEPDSDGEGGTVE